MIARTIRGRLITAFVVLALAFGGLSTLATAFLLEPYYLYRNRRELQAVAAEITRDLGPFAEPDYDLLGLITRSRNIHVVLLGTDGQTEYDSFQSMPAPRADPARAARPEAPPAPAVGAGEVTLIRTDPLLRTPFLERHQRLTDGRVLILRLPLFPIQQASDAAQLFALAIGLVLFVVASGAGALFARRFASPLSELTTIAGAIADLDFTNQFERTGDDEIARLGKSINRVSHRLAVALDELRVRNQALEIDIERERRIERNRRAFLANVSHELKTPIALIQGYAEGLRDDVADASQTRAEYASIIVDEAARMNRLVGELLDLGRLDAGAEVLNREEVDMLALLERCAAKFAAPAAGSEVTMTVSAPADLRVVADATRIEQVLINLLSNGVRHTPPGGQVTLAARATEPPGPSVTVTVANTGPHLPEGELDRIFESFHRADVARNRDAGGSGLGLAIARQIVVAHRGTITARNTETGVEVAFTLPAQ